MNHKICQKLCLKTCLSSICIFLLIFFLTDRSAAQHLVGTYTTTAPRASLYFLDPGYVNPAFGSGAIGIQSNPAGLSAVTGSRLSAAVATSQSVTTNFFHQLIGENDIYKPIQLTAQLNIEEAGGLGAVGFAHRSGNWVWGLTIMQARKGGLAFQANGSLDLSTHIDLETTITEEMVNGLPVDELPVRWDIEANGALNLQSTPAELSLSILPILGGISYQKGHFSLGAALGYYQLTSSNEIGQFRSHLEADATVIGQPHGIHPVSGLPWRGSIQADVHIVDEPLLAEYQFDISGHRLALSIGAMMNFKLLSLGFSYAQGFTGRVEGSYSIATITTVDLPDKNLLSDVELDLSLEPEIQGRASLALRDFQKDTVIVRDAGIFNVGGFHSLSAGVHFLIFGAFVSADIPKSFPNIYSTSFGVYSTFPIPKLPVRFNVGFITSSDGIMDNAEFSVPFRIVSHIGGGLSFKLPTHRWLDMGKEPAWLRLGVRSSLTSFVTRAIEAEANEAAISLDTSALFESAALSFGLTIPY